MSNSGNGNRRSLGVSVSFQPSDTPLPTVIKGAFICLPCFLSFLSVFRVPFWGLEKLHAVPPAEVLMGCTASGVRSDCPSRLACSAKVRDFKKRQRGRWIRLADALGFCHFGELSTLLIEPFN